LAYTIVAVTLTDEVWTTIAPFRFTVVSIFFGSLLCFSLLNKKSSTIFFCTMAYFSRQIRLWHLYVR